MKGAASSHAAVPLGTALATILLVEDDPLVRELIAMEIGKAKARRGLSPVRAGSC
jgi:hypothetical protein